MATITQTTVTCAHCGDPCTNDHIGNADADHYFCCEGCRMVYNLLNKNGLCDYYSLNIHPGQSQKTQRRSGKFAFLDDKTIAARLISFQDQRETHITLYLPQIHCSSCLYLLENLHKLHPAIIHSRVDFAAKQVFIIFEQASISLGQLAGILTDIRYEPHISLNQLGDKRPRTSVKSIYQLGVAGFCFANIMLLSFPEYLGLDASDKSLQSVFRTLNALLSLPVLLYSAQPFYLSAWKSLRHRFLNIDAPIALATLVTFSRSAYEVLSGTGAGYFDSMTGIVFFMLAGRMLQDRTYRQLSFERDYTSYFPVAVSVISEGKEIPRSLPEIKCGDTLLIHHGELIPADGILTRGQGVVDYSFVTGESDPVAKDIGELVYAGGRQAGPSIEVLVVKEVAQSYLTQLWDRAPDNKTHQDTTNPESQSESSFIHLLSRYFTVILFSIAAAAAIYWWHTDPSKIAGTVTAVLIVACPCALLLSTTFTNGNILRMLSRNRLYLRNPLIIESISETTHIVFDKTGTLTTTQDQSLQYDGAPLSRPQQEMIASLAAQSTHPLSKAIAAEYPTPPDCAVSSFKETPGKGIQGFVNGHFIIIGRSVSIDHKELGRFSMTNHYREGIHELTKQLSDSYHLTVLSGDNPREQARLANIFGPKAELIFNQSPHDKTAYIKALQAKGARVMMIGDGLNDAGALRQADTGIAIADNTNNFTPASDAILDSKQLYKLPAFISYCHAGKQIILTSFIMSILYNIVGLTFAVTGALSPMVAAILMPSSSLSILLLTFGCSSLMAKWLGL